MESCEKIFQSRESSTEFVNETIHQILMTVPVFNRYSKLMQKTMDPEPLTALIVELAMMIY